MSKKRFTFGPVSPNFAMIKDNGEPMDTEEVVDKLNEMTTKCSHLENENGELREQVQILKKEVRDFLHLCDVCDIQSHLSDECEEVLNDDY